MSDASVISDPRVGSAVIGAAVASIGWIVAGMRERGRDRRRRRERSTDTQTALLAEVQHYVDILSNPGFDLNTAWTDMVARMEADDSYVPLIPTERNDTVFQSMLGELQILPEAVIRPVVRYYNQVFAIEAIIADLRSDQFRSTPQAQRIKMYTDYISMKLTALDMGKEACAALDASLRAERARRTGWLSNLGVDPSGQ